MGILTDLKNQKQTNKEGPPSPKRHTPPICGGRVLCPEKFKVKERVQEKIDSKLVVGYDCEFQRTQGKELKRVVENE